MKNHYKYTSFVQKEQSLDNFYNYAVFNLEQPPPSSLPPPHRYVEIIVTGLNNTLKFVQPSLLQAADPNSIRDFARTSAPILFARLCFALLRPRGAVVWSPEWKSAVEPPSDVWTWGVWSGPPLSLPSAG